MSVKLKTRIQDMPNIWYMPTMDGSDVLLSAAYIIEEKRLFLRYVEGEQWFLYENVPAAWFRDFTLAKDKDAYVKATRKEVLTAKSKVHMLI